MRKMAIGLNRSGHITKISIMPIYGQKCFTQMARDIETDMQHFGFIPYQISSNDEPGLTFDIFGLVSNHGPPIYLLFSAVDCLQLPAAKPRLLPLPQHVTQT